MKQVMLLLAIIVTSLISNAQVNLPQPSSTQTIKQEFGMGAITVTYSRPNGKGRKIFGDLVPYNKLWRTGANAATKINFTDPVEIAGKKLDSGTYVLYSVPGVDSWEIILNKGLTNWGTEGYKEGQDVIRFKIEPLKIKPVAETFTIQFAYVQPQRCELQIVWAKTVVPITITTNIKDRLKLQIEKAMQTDKKPYWQAAQFYNEYEYNQAKALENCNKAIEANDKAYWIYLYKAKLQKEMGDKAGAKITAKKSLALAKEAKNDDYIKMNEELLRKLR